VIRRTLLVVAATVGAGCAGSPPQFYTLSANGAAAPPAAPTCSVTVGPVSLPEIVDRPQFVVRVAENQVELAEHARWAEPLKGAIPRVIAANLTHALSDARVSANSTDGDYRVLVEIQRFESVRGDAVTIDALWSVRPPKGAAARAGRSVARESVTGRDYDALAAAHSKALAVLSDDIAQAIRAYQEK
jgi:uncharacterized lipoprotein YmbA